MPKLTKTMLDNAKPPATGDICLWDSELPGFGVRVQCSGRKTYLIRYRTRTNAKQRKLTIARCCDMPPDKARELARKEFAKVAAGEDPASDRKPSRSSLTLKGMLQAYITSMRTKERVSADEVERCLLLAKESAAAELGEDRDPSSVTPDEICKLVAKIYARGHRSAADKMRGYIASAYAWAIKSANDYTVAQRQDWGVKHNPAADVAKDTGATGTRDRNLSAAELRALWLAADESSVNFSLQTSACIRLLICCGQRVMETLRVEGSEIDLQAKVWKMPVHKTKCKKHPHTVPLPDQAIEVLKQLIEIHGDGPLFPLKGGADGELMPPSSVNQAIRRWLVTVDVPHFQTRDIRRTWKSRAHDAGVDRFTRDLIQQHAQGGDTGSKHYDRADYDKQKQEGMQKWSTWLDKVLGDPAPVISIAA